MVEMLWNIFVEIVLVFLIFLICYIFIGTVLSLINTNLRERQKAEEREKIEQELEENIKKIFNESLLNEKEKQTKTTKKEEEDS